MATDTLKALNVAILVTDGFEPVELTEPRNALWDVNFMATFATGRAPLRVSAP